MSFQEQSGSRGEADGATATLPNPKPPRNAGIAQGEFSAPNLWEIIASPNDVFDIDDRCPGFAERFAAHADEMMAQQIELMRIQADQQIELAKRAQIGSFIIALVGLLTAGFLGHAGHGWPAFLVSVAAIGGPTVCAILATSVARKASDIFLQ